LHVPISKLVRIFRGSDSVRPLAVTGVALCAIAFTTAPLQNLVANGDTRSLSFAHIHTDETLTVTFKRRGRYDEAALKQLNWFLRDWRRDEPTTIDPHLFDVLWEVHREVKASGPVTIISAYRSPQTNSMLRARGRGVARYSQHMVGKAIDFYIPGIELADLRAMALRLQRGGVGFYPSSGSPFIHVDTGGVRHWPRVTRDELARIFPDGKTVHIPADGKPMPGFALAMAELESRGGRAGSIALASLDEDGEDRAANARSSRSRIPTATELTTASIPVSTNRDNAPTMVASLSPSSRIPTSKPAAVSANGSTPLPAARPGDMVVTGSLPRNETRALSYAATPERSLPQFGPIPGAHTRLADLPDQTRAPQSLQAVQNDADAARPPVKLLGMQTVASASELHKPDLYSLRGLVEPARAALRVQFASGSIEAPATAGFAGPAVVALQTLAFDRGAGIVTGRVTARN
jgi:uncharacterized protein YcbK (DUF882 family)